MGLFSPFFFHLFCFSLVVMSFNFLLLSSLLLIIIHNSFTGLGQADLEKSSKSENTFLNKNRHFLVNTYNLSSGTHLVSLCSFCLHFVLLFVLFSLSLFLLFEYNPFHLLSLCFCISGLFLFFLPVFILFHIPQFI